MIERDRAPETLFGSVADVTAAIFADAVTDIRRRVVEQGWFGAPQDGPLGPSSHLAGLGARQERASEPEAQASVSDVDPYDPWGWNAEPVDKTPNANEHIRSITPDRQSEFGHDL